MHLLIFLQRLLYFYGFKIEGFPFQNNLKTLDLSYKTDLDFRIDLKEKPFHF